MYNVHCIEVDAVKKISASTPYSGSKYDSNKEIGYKQL